MGRDALERKLLTSEALADMEPFVLIGLPAVVVLRAVARSPAGEEIELADGFVLTHANAPRSQEAQKVWKKILEAKLALGAAAPSADDFQALEASVLVGQAEPESLPEDARKMLFKFEGIHSRQRSQLKTVQSAVVDVAIELTRLPMFQSRFDEVFEDILAQRSGCCRCL